MKPHLSVSGSGDRWFWCCWLDADTSQTPDFSGYAVSRSAAIAQAEAQIGKDYQSLKSDAAQKWRGLTKPCPKCGSSVKAIGEGKERHPASLNCGGCGVFLKWIGKGQLELLQGLGVRA